MKQPRDYRCFDYRKSLLPNEYLASLEEGVTNLEEAKSRTGLSFGYPGWGLLYYVVLCNLDSDGENVLLETGGNVGSSTIVIAQALKDSGLPGHVYSVELDSENHLKAVENIEKAGVSDLVSLSLGDSIGFLSEFGLKNKRVRFALLDSCHDCDHVVKEFELVHPMLADESLVFFDNTYRIAEAGEDDRVNGALKTICRRFGGHVINLERTSWFTPGQAIWQRHGFARDWCDCEVASNQEEDGVDSRDGSDSRLCRRELDHDEIIKLQRACSLAFGSAIAENEIRSVMQECRRVESRMKGRAAGDVVDLIIRYFVRYFSSTGGASGLADGHHVEIGALFGASTILTAKAVTHAGADVPTVVIDPFEGYYGKDLDVVTKLKVDEATFRENLATFGISSDRVKVLLGYSQQEDIVAECRQMKILSLLIDGDHSYEGVKNDWVNYAPLVVPGGYVMIDDYNSHAWPEVTEFVNSEVMSNLAGLWEVALVYGSSIVLRRTGAAMTDAFAYAEKLLHDLKDAERREAELKSVVAAKEKTIAEEERICSDMKTSMSWRITAPLRALARFVRR